MLDETTLSLIRTFSYNHSEKDDIHGYSHVERVYDLCLKLGKKLNANLLVLQVAALLHDVGRFQGANNIENKNHAERSSEIASNYLKSVKFDFSPNDFKNIIHSIRAHSFSNHIFPETLEAKILSDVDKLDALGAIGLYRTIGFTIKNQGGIDHVIEHLENKILKLKDRLYLDYSKELAIEKQKIILDFYNEIVKKF
ncbi:MAG: HD domain-containing protein [Promethearchaeota archaeon]